MKFLSNTVIEATFYGTETFDGIVSAVQALSHRAEILAITIRLRVAGVHIDVTSEMSDALIARRAAMQVCDALGLTRPDF